MEWKHISSGQLQTSGPSLETSLVEWKPAKVYPKNVSYVALGNFLSGMETFASRPGKNPANHLGNFLSGMETRSLSCNLQRFGKALETSLVEWKHAFTFFVSSGLYSLGNFLSGMETAFRRG